MCPESNRTVSTPQCAHSCRCACGHTTSLQTQIAIASTLGAQPCPARPTPASAQPIRPHVLSGWAQGGQIGVDLLELLHGRSWPSLDSAKYHSLSTLGQVSTSSASKLQTSHRTHAAFALSLQPACRQHLSLVAKLAKDRAGLHGAVRVWARQP